MYHMWMQLSLLRELGLEVRRADEQRRASRHVAEQHQQVGSARVGAVGLREDAPLGAEPLEDRGAPEDRGAIRVEAVLEARRRSLGGEDAVVPREAKRRQ